MKRHTKKVNEYFFKYKNNPLTSYYFDYAP